MRTSIFRRAILVMLALAWLFIVTLSYYIVHKPFSGESLSAIPNGLSDVFTALAIGGENLFAILNVLGDVFVALVIFAVSAALGRRLLVRLDFPDSFTALVFGTGLGLGILSFTTLALGLVGLLYPVLFWLLLLAALFLLRADLLAIGRELRAIGLSIESRFERGLILFISLVLLLALLSAVAPPIAWDTQTYHLVEGKVALEQGRIAVPPDIPYFSFPALVEMLYLAGMVLKGDGVAALIHFGFLILTLGGVMALAMRYFSARVAWLACAILVAIPSLVLVATWAYVDLALAFYTLAAFYAALLAREEPRAGWFALAGTFAGLALGIKYTAAIVPLALVVLFLRVPWSSIIRYLSFVALFAAPWYLRNLVFTGNPVYPFFFGGPFWDAFRGEWFGRFGTGLLASPLQLILAPWDATILGTEGGAGYAATIGPLLLMFIPLLLLTVRRFRNTMPPDRLGVSQSRRTSSPFSSILVFVGILYLFWLCGIAGSKLLIQTRLLFPAFPLLALLAAITLDRLAALDLAQLSMRRFARLVVVLVLGLTAVGYIFDFASDNPLAYLTGFQTREHFLARHLGAYYDAVKFLNTQLPANAHVLFLWEPRSYYVDRAAQPDAILDLFAHWSFKYKNADAMAAAMRQAGYTHVLLNRAGLDYMLQTGYDPISPKDAQVLQDLSARYWKQVYGQNGLEIVSRESKPGLLDAENDAYAVYEVIR